MLSRRIGQANFLPFDVRSAWIQAGDPSCPEQELFRETIARAILDALGYTGLSEPDEHFFAVLDARDWFEKSQDLAYIFELAGVHPVLIRDTILKTKPLTEVSDRGRAKPSAPTFKVEKKRKKKGRVSK